MNDLLERTVKDAAVAHGRDRHRLLDIVRDIQAKLGRVPGEAMGLIAHEVNAARVDVEGLVSFYAFLSTERGGRHVIRVTDCLAAKMRGAEQVVRAFEAELGIRCGETTEDGTITLLRTSCMGMCDQGPAALCDDIPITRLSTDRVRDVVRILRETGEPGRLVRKLGEGQNASDGIRAMVHNNIRRRGEVVFSPWESGAAIRNAVAMSPREVIRSVKTARLRGRGGAGFPTGMKWEFCRKAAEQRKIVICNADEGEPGTFKDRVILTECPDLFIEGMTVAGYAIGAAEGIIYLRGEYQYLAAYLNEVLSERRRAGLLGRNVAGKAGFDFDVRIQLGAGAYICGEESALIQSCEGKRGSPRDRPPFPAEHGYLGLPTNVNNVETFCCVSRVLSRGAGWFAAIGSEQSTGTKLLSVSGDCIRPGVYELPFGFTLTELLQHVGGEEAKAIQVGGPSGACVDRGSFGRRISFEDLCTGGSMMVFGPGRDMLEVASSFMDFFIEESCGYCTPCRVGNVLIKERLDRIRRHEGIAQDLDYLEELCLTTKKMSRCGLGKTSPNPVHFTLANFRKEYQAKLLPGRDRGRQPDFHLDAALAESAGIAGRTPVSLTGGEG